MMKRNLTVRDLADILDVSVSQIYKWDREGISKYNPHYTKLKTILPEVQPKVQKTKKNGEEDGRYRSGRKRNKLVLKDSVTPQNTEKEFESALFPKIHINKKTT